jgi:RNA ligase (TIGR02306 family)
MSKFSVPVCRVVSVEDHPNADRLSIVMLEGLGWVCISAKLEDGCHRYKVGDLCVYIPSAALLPEWLLKSMGFWNEQKNVGMLSGSNGNRVKALKLRGVFSEGLLYPVHEHQLLPHLETGWGYITDANGESCKVFPGMDVAEILGITKYEPPIPVAMAGEVANVSEAATNYDFERWESVPDIFDENTRVNAVEKAHGTFCLMQYIPGLNHLEMFGEQGNITVSSKGLGKQGLVFKNNSNNDGNLYVRNLRELLDNGFEQNMRAISNTHSNTVIKIYGEIFGGSVQDLKYGTNSPEFRVFDVQIGKQFLTRRDAEIVCRELELEMLPVLYSGPFDLDAIVKVRDGKTMIGGDNIREGVVVTCADGGYHSSHGRKICKFISPAYLTRSNKDATEFQ